MKDRCVKNCQLSLSKAIKQQQRDGHGKGNGDKKEVQEIRGNHSTDSGKGDTATRSTIRRIEQPSDGKKNRTMENKEHTRQSRELSDELMTLSPRHEPKSPGSDKSYYLCRPNTSQQHITAARQRKKISKTFDKITTFHLELVKISLLTKTEALLLTVKCLHNGLLSKNTFTKCVLTWVGYLLMISVINFTTTRTKQKNHYRDLTLA